MLYYIGIFLAGDLVCLCADYGMMVSLTRLIHVLY